ncbi:MAG: FtsB family cell division protein [Gammaproteobacteria bacterium]
MRWVVLFALVICFIFLQRGLWSTASGLPYGWRLNTEIAKRKQENAKLARENAERLQEVKALKAGGAAIEEHARTDLGWVKHGETFYQIVRAPASAAKPSRATVPAPASGR